MNFGCISKSSLAALLVEAFLEVCIRCGGFSSLGRAYVPLRNLLPRPLHLHTGSVTLHPELEPSKPIPCTLNLKPRLGRVWTSQASALLAALARPAACARSASWEAPKRVSGLFF